MFIYINIKDNQTWGENRNHSSGAESSSLPAKPTSQSEMWIINIFFCAVFLNYFISFSEFMEVMTGGDD